ncbi:MAG: exodeoxyribonuclease VII large subunit [Planctomycetes bacterium]|jgi:exodeoxyribonuclease VII large subunit|nr:exodeoxyribonuclease VII large subunit [Planctomycetota bacterium]
MQVSTQTRTKVYTVTQVNTLVKDVLEANLPSWLTIKGEITDWKEHQSGHRYFSLKDEESVLPCAMWRGTLAKVKFKPGNGLAVLVTGSIDLYVPQGRYKLIVDEMIPAGMGALQLAFEQMVRKLEAEGLFSEAHKKPIPKYPERIGILTSESGAAVHDIAVSIHNRWPCTRLFLYPVPVQGPGAAQAMAAGIREVNRRNDKLKLDALIIGRGGGSLEDLWAFNEEVLARAIFASRIPIISAVGHEVDTTVADLVADARASTPTKAGVVAVPDMVDVLSDLAHHQRRLAGSVRSRYGLCCGYLQTILASAVFRNPLLSVLNREQYLDDLAWSLGDGMRTALIEARGQVQEYQDQVARIEPHRLLGRLLVELNDLRGRGLAAVTKVLSRRELEITARENRLAALNPKSVLNRGYSITTNQQTGQVVRSADEVQPDDLLTTELAHGQLIESRVTRS